ncbi:Undecaprenyl-phosphate galactosephosphotransferase [hydrothermal vent metagenome]|uniref:Undecaprenyl-phosphate galactosephosphotransferase n=1 Tax=hydrothermal vent metagenome TaxID=652676 RepID=A0A3B0VPZ5_9ZZZZ
MSHQRIRIATILSDLLLINAGFALAYVIRYRWQWLLPVDERFFEPYSRYFSQQIVLNILLVITFLQMRVWRRKRGEFWVDELSRITYATAAGIGLMSMIAFFVQPEPFSRLMLAWVFLAIVLFIGVARLIRRWLLSWLYQRSVLVDRVLVIGSGEVGRSLIRTLLARPDLGYQTVGYLHDGLSENNIGLGRIPNLGMFTDLQQMLAERPQLHTVFIALPGEMHQQISRLLHTCQAYGVRAQVVPDLLQLSMNRVEFNNMAGIPILGVRDVGISWVQQLVKRLLDLAIILLGGIPAFLVMGVIALAIKLDSPGPVIYKAARVGRNGRSFQMYKFRSMVVDADQYKEALKEQNQADGPLFKMKDDPRMTRVGRLIRRASLDELPQIYNVLLGQMSLVGPRPPLAEEVAAYKPWHKQRLSVIGGVTGLWQVSGRSDLTFDELCLLDIYYIENWSLALDIRILLQTIPHSLFGRGAY